MLNATATEIFCRTPSNRPGQHRFSVLVKDKGEAQGQHVIHYNLSINSIYPHKGSVFGGTTLTIKGTGFTRNSTDVHVRIGRLACDVQSSTTDTIQCKTRPSGKTINIDNSARHPDYGVGYAWNVTIVNINVGDNVKWSWGSNPLSNLKIGVYQSTQLSSLYDGTGFSSSRGSSGTYTFKSERPGTFYFSSGAIDPAGRIKMNGRIEVGPLKSSIANINVIVAGYKALNEPVSASILNVSQNSCVNGLSTNFTNKCADLNFVSSDNSSFRFLYSDCHTPAITNLSPRWITKDSNVVINGIGFSNEPCHNTVKLGTHVCDVIASTDTAITCRINLSNSPPVNTHLKVSVNVNNRGNAVNSIAIPVNETLRMHAMVTAIVPNSGSFEGGTKVEIGGFGFTNSTAAMVTIGMVECNITSIVYTRIKCTTGKLTTRQNQTWKLTARINGDNAICNDTSGSNCMFNYATVQTPMVHEVPNRVINGVQYLDFIGMGFGASSSDLVVAVGPTTCNVITVNDTHLRCLVQGVIAGDHNAHIYKNPAGYAWFNVSEKLEGLAAVSSVFPNSGSVHGGFDVTITGNGVVCTTPAGTGMKNLALTSSGVSFRTVSFTFDPTISPSIASLTPAHGRAGQTITISGSNFNGSTLGVKLGTAECNHFPSESGFGGGRNVTLRGYGFSPNDTVTNIANIKIVSVSPARGGTGGGVRLIITGTSLNSTSGPTTVNIANAPCAVQSSTATEIICITGPSKETIKTQVRVDVGTNGKALQLNASFFYVDVWPSKFSWGGKDPPAAGSFVQIKAGQKMLIDTDTPVMKMLLIDVREGTLECYGKHIKHTWTQLSETANATATTIKLLLPAQGWNIGDEIVIASTTKSIRENEVVKITGKRDGDKTLDISPALKYRHTSFSQQ
eukprot:gene6709-7471_t